MNSTANGIRLDVSRGPNWLFLRLEADEPASDLAIADEIWSIVARHFVYRVVLEFGPGFKTLTPALISQLDEVRRRLEEQGGALRVCGLNKTCAERLEKYCAESKMRSRLTTHSTIAAAVFGVDSPHSELPGKPHAAYRDEPVTQDTAYEALRVH